MSDNDVQVLSVEEVALGRARESVQRLKGLAEPARGGRLVDSDINDVAAELDAALNEVSEAYRPVDKDVSAVSKFLKDLNEALDKIRDKHTKNA